MLGMFLLGTMLGIFTGAYIMREGVKGNIEKAKDLDDFKRLQNMD